MKKAAILPVLFVAIFSFSACNFADETESASEALQTSQTDSLGSVSAASSSEMFANSDVEIGYDEETGVKITLSGDSASSDSSAVQISGGTVMITKAGTYILSGTLNDGMVVVDAGAADRIQLVLDGAEITSSTSAALCVLEADKVFITTVSGTENTLANGGEYTAIDSSNIDAAVFSKSDLTLNGAGNLTVSAAAGEGIVSTENLILTSGTYHITAAGQGLSGRESVRIANGTYTIAAGKDGICAENTEDASQGYLYISGGTFTIAAQGNGMSAGSDLQIKNGSFAITAGEGSASAAESSVSQKGIKAGGTITILGGTIAADTVDDSIHAAGDILITGGRFELESGGDAIHSDFAVAIQNGDFTIASCYEGVEGLSVAIESGTFHITSADDGINAAGGADGSGFGGAYSGQEQFSPSSEGFITINGGEIVIVSAGDCIDSKGDFTINGGTLNLTCNGTGETAIDCGGTYTNNGGNVTTSDSSENNLNQTGEGMAD